MYVIKEKTQSCRNHCPDSLVCTKIPNHMFVLRESQRISNDLIFPLY